MPRVNPIQWRSTNQATYQPTVTAEAQRDGSVRIMLASNGHGMFDVLPSEEADSLGKFLIEWGIAYRSSIEEPPGSETGTDA